MRPKTNWGALFADLHLILLAPLILFLSLVPFCFAPEDSASWAMARMSVGVAVFWISGLMLMSRFGLSRSDALHLPKGPRVQSALRVALVLLAGLLCIAASSGSSSVWPSFHTDPGMKQLFRATKDVLPLMVVASVFHAVGEEIFFRGFLYNYLKRFFSIRSATLLTAVLFASSHLPSSSWRFFFLFYFGLAMTIAYERFGSILYPVIMHYVINVAGLFSRVWQARHGRFHLSLYELGIIFLLHLFCWFGGALLRDRRGAFPSPS